MYDFTFHPQKSSVLLTDKKNFIKKEYLQRTSPDSALQPAEDMMIWNENKNQLITILDSEENFALQWIPIPLVRWKLQIKKKVTVFPVRWLRGCRYGRNTVSVGKAIRLSHILLKVFFCLFLCWFVLHFIYVWEYWMVVMQLTGRIMSFCEMVFFIAHISSCRRKNYKVIGEDKTSTRINVPRHTVWYWILIEKEGK